jgi:hypothetical protein
MQEVDGMSMTSVRTRQKPAIVRRSLAGWEKTGFVYMTEPNRKSFYVK